MKLLRKLPVHALVVGILLGVTATIAFSLYVVSPLKSLGCYLGYCYENQSDLSGAADEAVFSAGTVLFADDQAPVGYMGARARLLRNGLLCTSTDYDYNTEPLYGYGIGINGSCGAGDYQSLGYTAAYNGDGYSYSPTYLTPIIHKN